MAKRKSRAAGIDPALLEVATLFADPEGTQADRVLDAIVGRYTQTGHRLLNESGLTSERMRPAWTRLLQVRFVLHVCRDKPGVAQGMEKLLATRPPIETVLREVLRAFFVELKAWDSKAAPPKKPETYWREAFDALRRDVEAWDRDGVRIDEAAAGHVQILGVDYNLSPTEWMGACES